MSAGLERRRTGTFVAGGKARTRPAELARIARAVETPAFVIDERAIVSAARRGRVTGFDPTIKTETAIPPSPEGDGILAAFL
jgi:hypothetical protein